MVIENPEIFNGVGYFSYLNRKQINKPSTLLVAFQVQEAQLAAMVALYSVPQLSLEVLLINELSPCLSY